MAERDRNRRQRVEELFKTKVDPKLQSEIEAMEYKGIDEKFTVFMDLNQNFTSDVDWVIYGNVNLLKKKAERYQGSIVSQLIKLGKTDEEYRQYLLFNKIGAHLTPSEIRQLSTNHKIKSISWNSKSRIV